MAGQDTKGSSKAPAEKEDELDLNLSPPCFLAPVARSIFQTRSFIFVPTNQLDGWHVSLSALC